MRLILMNNLETVSCSGIVVNKFFLDQFSLSKVGMRWKFHLCVHISILPVFMIVSLVVYSFFQIICQVTSLVTFSRGHFIIIVDIRVVTLMPGLEFSGIS